MQEAILHLKRADPVLSAIIDRAANVCPVGAILVKDSGFKTPIGERTYDRASISAEADSCEVPERT